MFCKTIYYNCAISPIPRHRCWILHHTHMTIIINPFVHLIELIRAFIILLDFPRISIKELSMVYFITGYMLSIIYSLILYPFSPCTKIITFYWLST